MWCLGTWFSGTLGSVGLSWTQCSWRAFPQEFHVSMRGWCAEGGDGNGMRAVTACAPWKAALSSQGLGGSLPGDRSCGGSWAEGGAPKSSCSVGHELSLPTLTHGAWLEMQTPCPASMELCHKTLLCSNPPTIFRGISARTQKSSFSFPFPEALPKY